MSVDFFYRLPSYTYILCSDTSSGYTYMLSTVWFLYIDSSRRLWWWMWIPSKQGHTEGSPQIPVCSTQLNLSTHKTRFSIYTMRTGQLLPLVSYKHRALNFNQLSEFVIPLYMENVTRSQYQVIKADFSLQAPLHQLTSPIASQYQKQSIFECWTQNRKSEKQPHKSHKQFKHTKCSEERTAQRSRSKSNFMAFCNKANCLPIGTTW